MPHHKVGDVMTTDVATTTPIAAVKRAVDLMRTRQVNALPVVDGDGRLLGILSRADVIAKQSDAAVDRPWRRKLRRRQRIRAHARSVGELMTSPAHTVAADVTIAEAAQIFARYRLNQLPVTENGILVGIVSRIDLMRTFLRSDTDLTHDVEDALARGFGISITPATVRVSVLNGVVTLHGKLETKSSLPIAAAVARAVDGVVDVECLLDFERDDTHDPEVRLAAQDVTWQGGWSNR
ncbi:CBS domain-containing protein [Labedaea rhizosphaerae]|uniref:BON domain-containing protein n=1 Tax=Labedaea rhizosphaerae TaxID=598644 RepID=A0A4R6SFX0_LABRH|nr:CBS domain-containing protein [Labedaea rhizosphaerae]TDQ00410.1 BON domain-containing protein [Labedaea rhizosphaerae]